MTPYKHLLTLLACLTLLPSLRADDQDEFQSQSKDKFRTLVIKGRAEAGITNLDGNAIVYLTRQQVLQANGGRSLITTNVANRALPQNCRSISVVEDLSGGALPLRIQPARSGWPNASTIDVGTVNVTNSGPQFLGPFRTNTVQVGTINTASRLVHSVEIYITGSAIDVTP